MNKLLRFGLVILALILSVVSVNALSPSGADKGYWTLDTTLNDATPNGNTAIANGGLFRPGIINDGYEFTTDNLTLPNVYDIGTGELAISLWFNDTSIGSFKGIIADKYDISVPAPRMQVYTDSTNHIRAEFRGAASTTLTSNITYSANTWYHLVINRNGASCQMYINAQLVATSGTCPTDDIDNGNGDYQVGRFEGVSDFAGRLDEIYIRDEVLTTGEITDLYNSGAGLQYPFQSSVLSYQNINLVNGTNTNQSILNVAINVTDLNDLSQNINTTMYINNGSSYLIGINTENVSFSKTFSEGSFDIWFFSINNASNITSSNYSYLFDLTNPSLTDNLSQTINSYDMNLSDYISFSDTLSGIDYCDVTFSTGQISNCVNQSFTFALNGNITYSIEVKDNAGNSNTSSGTVYVNPYQNFSVYDVFDGVFLSNFTLQLNSETNYSTSGSLLQILTYDFNVGENNTLQVFKTGDSRAQRTFVITTTSNLNETINTTKAVFTLFFRDVDTNALLDNTTITFDIIGSEFAQEYNTTNGTAIIGDFNSLPDVYNIITNAIGYEQNSRYFTFNGLDNISLTIYLLDSTNPNVDTLTVIVRDRSLDELAGILVTLRRYDINTNDYIAVNQIETNSLGAVIFDLDYNDKYQFVLSDGVDTVTTIGQFITSSPLFLTFDPTEATIDVGNGVSIYSSITATRLTNVTHTFKWDYNDPLNAITQACLEVYLLTINTETLLDFECSSSTSGSINAPDNGSYTTQFSKTYLVKGYVILNGQRVEVDSGRFTFYKFTSGWSDGLGLFFIIGVYSLLIFGAILVKEIDPYIFIGLGVIPLFIGGLFGALPIVVSAVIGFVALITFIILTKK